MSQIFRDTPEDDRDICNAFTLLSSRFIDNVTNKSRRLIARIAEAGDDAILRRNCGAADAARNRCRELRKLTGARIDFRFMGECRCRANVHSIDSHEFYVDGKIVKFNSSHARPLLAKSARERT